MPSISLITLPSSDGAPGVSLYEALKIPALHPLLNHQAVRAWVVEQEGLIRVIGEDDPLPEGVPHLDIPAVEWEYEEFLASRQEESGG